MMRVGAGTSGWPVFCCNTLASTGEPAGAFLGLWVDAVHIQPAAQHLVQKGQAVVELVVAQRYCVVSPVAFMTLYIDRSACRGWG